MPPARNLLRRQYDCYGGCSDDTHLEIHQEKASLILNLMVDDFEGPRSDEKMEEEEEEEVGTSSKEGDEGWLQLGIGDRSSGGPDLGDGRARGRGPTMELSLFSDKPPGPRPMILRPPSSISATTMNIQGMVPLLPRLDGGLGYRSEVPWGIRSLNSMSTTSTMMMGHISQQFGCPSRIHGSGEEMMAVRPPPRPLIGMWFMLRAAQNQVKEPFLPQIPKSYLRIKDGRMTVRLLMKYLASKLGLNDESEVEITCRGQQLHCSLTLQHVRDNIWYSTEAEALPPDSTSTTHLMILQYGRRASSETPIL